MEKKDGREREQKRERGNREGGLEEEDEMLVEEEYE